MYTAYFGLKENPFSISPDPRYLYMSEQHREALAHLVYGINTDGGFVMLTGEVGTGKTTVCRCLLDQISDNIDLAFILNPKMTVEELLASICDELRIQYPQDNSSIKVFIDNINKYLLDAHARGRKTVLIIEEAQNLSTDVLEQIRLLTNLETNQQKLLQIIMLGQTELRYKLSHPELRQLSQRITARYHLGPIDRQEVSEYVNHRLSVAGVNRKLFTDPTIKSLYRRSRGIPRLINLICDRALLGAYAQGKDMVDRDTLIKASHEVSGKSSILWLSNKTIRWFLPGIILSGLLILAFIMTTPSSEKNISNSLTTKNNHKLTKLVFPEEIPVSKSKEAAYQALFKQWGIIYKPDKQAPCQQAQAQGLKCLKARGSLGSLIQLNRPAILKLFDNKNHEFYITLTELKEHVATLLIGTKTKLVDVKDIALHWHGDYIILWRMPKDYRGYIKYGSRGPQVQWLVEKLALFQGQQIDPLKDPVFDDEVLKRVKEFQFSKGLVPDGIVGPQTFIHLNSIIESRDPVLSGEQKGT